MSELDEKRNQKIGWSVSIGIHIALLLLFIFLLAWREPNPPYPEYGIEINFGTDAAGTGDIQPENEPAAQQEEEQPRQEEEPQQLDQPQEEQQPQEQVQEEVPETVTDTESPEVIEEKPVQEKEKTEPVKEEIKKEITQPKTEQTQQKEVSPKETSQKQEEAKSTSQGDNTNTTGDKGDPKGDLDSRALYGQPGGGNNGPATLEMPGWGMPNDLDMDPYDETGYIVFEIEVDQNGDVIKAQATSYSVTLQVVRFYQDQIRNFSFVKTSNGPAPARSKGKLTIRLKKN